MKEFLSFVGVVICVFSFVAALALKYKWETAATNTLRCGEKGAEVVERPAAEGLVTTKFIVCKK
jgi:hypothetical protein